MSEKIILCIDDDLALSGLLTQRLSAAEYSLLRASDADHAWLMFEENHPDLVLLEVSIQRGAGWQLLDRLLAANARVIIVSIQGLEEDIVRGLELGAVDYITKPYRSAELIARLQLRLQQPPPVTRARELSAAPPAKPTRGKSKAPFVQQQPPPALALEQEPLPAPAEAQEDAILPSSFGPRLRHARRLRAISLVQAELETHIRLYYIQALEEEKFALLPRGTASEKIVRDYARFLGEDPRAAVEEYRRLHHQDPVPTFDFGPGLSRGPKRSTRVLVWLSAALLGLALALIALNAFVPDQMTTLWRNARGLVIAQATATATPTLSPTLTPRPTATATATLTPRPTATPVPPSATPTAPLSTTPTP